jgi:hypothetical protein
MTTEASAPEKGFVRIAGRAAFVSAAEILWLLAATVGVKTCAGFKYRALLRPIQAVPPHPGLGRWGVPDAFLPAAHSPQASSNHGDTLPFFVRNGVEPGEIPGDNPLGARVHGKSVNQGPAGNGKGRSLSWAVSDGYTAWRLRP